jgi:hypothetical protein
MSVRDEVRRTQRSLAALDAAHGRAISRLDQARARRSDALAAADQAVAVAQESVERAIGDMAKGVGVDLTAQMLGVEIAEIRRIVRAAQGPSEVDGDGRARRSR